MFVWTAKRSIKHVISGMCLSLKGKNLVLQNGCDRRSNMRFRYIKRRKRLMISKKRWTVEAVQSGSEESGIALVAKKRVSNAAQAKFTFKSKRLNSNWQFKLN